MFLFRITKFITSFYSKIFLQLINNFLSNPKKKFSILSIIDNC